VPYGAMVVLRKDFNIETATYTPPGATSARALLPEEKAILYAMQDYGGYVLIRAGSGAVTFFVEGGPGTDSTIANNMKNVLSAFVTDFRVAANSADVGTLDADRMPTDRTRIAGGGTRRRDPLPPVVA
jgi:hypothetical protein